MLNISISHWEQKRNSKYLVSHSKYLVYNVLLLRYVAIAYVSYIFIHYIICWYFWFFMPSHALHNVEISDISCILMHCALLKYLISHILSYAEISDFSYIKLCWNIWFLMYYVMLKYLISHVLHNAEMSDFSYFTLSKLFVWLPCISLCRKIRFLINMLYWNICLHL